MERPASALVTPELWERANRQLTANRSVAKRNMKKGEYFLRRLVTCGGCDLRMASKTTYPAQAALLVQLQSQMDEAKRRNDHDTERGIVKQPVDSVAVNEAGKGAETKTNSRCATA